MFSSFATKSDNALGIGSFAGINMSPAILNGAVTALYGSAAALPAPYNPTFNAPPVAASSATRSASRPP